MTRKVGEGIMIGDEVHVVINKVRDGQVRLAICAPKSVRIKASAMASRRFPDVPQKKES